MRQTEQGKAFEYALAHQLNIFTNAGIVINSASTTAQNYYEHNIHRLHMDMAASEATIFLQCHDPRIDNATSIRFQADDAGKSGDVRDIVIEIVDNEIGISAKHNHHAVKHSWLSDLIDLGKLWGDHPVSSTYWKSIKPIFQDMRGLWEIVYKRLFQYLLGNQDYYKVVCEQSNVYIQSVNINGTLKWGKKWKIPDRIEQIQRKPRSNSTILVSFIGGWQLSFRIHNASAKVEPSLKFDIQFVGLPQVVTKTDIPLSN